MPAMVASVLDVSQSHRIEDQSLMFDVYFSDAKALALFSHANWPFLSSLESIYLVLSPNTDFFFFL